MCMVSERATARETQSCYHVGGENVPSLAELCLNKTETAQTGEKSELNGYIHVTVNMINERQPYRCTH